MTPTILIIRPDPAGPAFADQIRARLGCGVSIVLSPIMRIAPAGPLPDLTGIKTLIFTSRNGVAAYAGLGGGPDISAYAVGEATAREAEKHGISVIAGDGDANALVAQMMADKVAGPCLHLRGEHAVGDIAGRLTLAGIETQEAIIYRQIPESLTDEANTLLQRESPVILPLFSPRSARLFFQGAQINAPLLVASLSEKVAAEVPKGAAKMLEIAKSPDAQAVLDLLPGLCAAVKPLEGRNLAQ